jgi:hypothetical protein
MSKFYVTEQASKYNGEVIETTFNTGAFCRHGGNGSAQYYAAPNARGLTRSLHPAKNGKLIAKMNELAAAGIK